MSEYRYDFYSRHGGKIAADREVAIRTCASFANGADLLACDSAEKVYRATLSAMGVRHAGAHVTALPALLDGHKQNIGRGGRVLTAMDSGASDSFPSRYPEIARFKIMG